MCISLAKRFIVPWVPHIRLGIENMVWDGRHHLCAVHVVNDMRYVVFDCCNVYCVDVLFFKHVVLRSCTANCGTSSHFYIPDGSRVLKCNKNRYFFWSFHHLRRGILFFILLSCFKQCVLGLSGLLGLNAVIMLPFYCNTIIVWSLEMFRVVSQAFTSMLAKRGTFLCVDVLRTTLMVC